MVIKKKKLVPSFWIRNTFFIFIFRSNKQRMFLGSTKEHTLDFSGHKTKTPKIKANQRIIQGWGDQPEPWPPRIKI
jgi:hypothetical protein